MLLSSGCRSAEVAILRQKRRLTPSALLERLGTRAHLVGSSDGGIVAAITTLRRPEWVDRLVLIGANFHYDGLVHFEIQSGDPTWEFIASRYAALSPRRTPTPLSPRRASLCSLASQQ
ncbi:MAG TPA: alpha/beta hydrolase [Acidimicrobiales bacterium]